MSQHTFPRHAFGLLALMTLFWGINWPIIKIVLTEMAPLHFRVWCLGAGTVGLFALAAWNRQPMAVPRGQWPRLLVISFLNLTCWNVFAVYGITMMASGRAAILGYTMPVWGVLFSTWMLKEPLTRRRLAGVTLGMGGMLLLFSTEFAALERAPLGALLMIAAAVTWAMGVVTMKRWPVDLPATPFTAWQMLLGGVPIVLGALFLEQGSFDLAKLSLWPLLGALYNMFIAFIYCYWAWTKIAMIAPVGVSSIATLMTPVLGVFSGMIVLGERPHWQDFAALGLVVVALATVLLPPRARKI